jgi:hypothetical protein
VQHLSGPQPGGRMDASTPAARTSSGLILCVSALRRHSSVPLLAIAFAGSPSPLRATPTPCCETSAGGIRQQAL